MTPRYAASEIPGRRNEEPTYTSIMHNINYDALKRLQSEELVISFLDNLCLSLDLTNSQRKVAEDRYAAVTSLLASADSRLAAFSPHLFPQGSFLLKTVVKPMADIEYDVDLICLLHSAGYLSAREMFTLIATELKSRYKDLVVKDRCCRIDYAGEFHMDIIPARHENAFDLNRVVVPDRRLNNFVWSCPKHFATWFDEIAQLSPVFARAFSANVINAKSAAVVEPLPDYDGMATEPLRRFVQIFKASRNHFYQDRGCRPISSIALTTLTAHSYRKAVAAGVYGSMMEVFRFVAEDLHRSIKVSCGLSGTPEFILENPKDARENFLDCWEGDAEAHKVFLKWQSQMVIFIDEIIAQADTPNGIDGTKKRLAAAFGESAATAALRGVAGQRREMVSLGRAGVVASGILTTSSHAGSKPVPRHTFDGRP